MGTSRLPRPESGIARPATDGQLPLLDPHPPLSGVTFVVVDLETTGGATSEAGITEIGAVKVRGGEQLGTFQTLVNPGTAIPPFVAALTGITDSLVASAPPLAAVLPAFLEFLGDGVLVAHNAPYDVGFLSAGCKRLERDWPRPIVLDTVRLARVVLHRDEVPNCKLATLATHFRARVTPTHRALDDALATTDVLHALLERAGNLGAQTMPDVLALCTRVSRAQRTKRHLADALPAAPGVYVFRDQQGAALYVGTSRSIRARVRAYFTAAEQRRRMAEMIELAHSVTPIVCATPLEAHVREIRLIASEQPRYNQRSRRPAKFRWLKLTAEPAPRLSVVGHVDDDHAAGARYLGPFPSAQAAQEAAAALTLAYPIRTCTPRLARTPRRVDAGCSLAELGRCLAPCTAGSDRIAYDGLVDALRSALDGDLRATVAAAERRMRILAAEERFEEAARWRERLRHALVGSLRTQRVGMLAAEPELVAAEADADGAWHIHVIRHGHLAAAGRAERGENPRPVVDALVARADHVTARPHPAPAALIEETLVIGDWLHRGTARIVRGGPVSWPIHCGGASLERIEAVRSASLSDALVADVRAAQRSGGAGRPLGPADATGVTRIRTA